MGLEGPSSPFSRLLGPVLLQNADGKAAAGAAAAAGAGAAAAAEKSSLIPDFLKFKQTFNEAPTNKTLGEKDSITALYFTGKGVEQILQVRNPNQ